MRNRTPNQLHASLYMQERFKEKNGSRTSKTAEARTKRMSKNAEAETIGRKK